ncbi:divalent-cation tolerance protein CutA [Siccirubricoccus deserti]|uniref:Divalent-cation tolerance protein CutA n=1 Tax=Siccirubricoccus deserti TaxID=2013562 RepID=A0A9X0R1K0_9PROT|nr:divalent-cation tolerance protein CutA [Siccirubricoccus deserti]MBC4017855.1 divalent-cation tolerance protein CutA [Siccirubricoccus deserti]GGC53319.1 divalent-cation tolerance protein CutA [Siccirubricoccus deserti]
MGDDVLWVYVTAADTAEARRIGRVLVEEGLAACANILPGHTAIYRWEGRVEEAAEAAFVAKTTAARFEALRARIRTLHSYTTPAILALPAVVGDADFLAWVRESTKPS